MVSTSRRFAEYSATCKLDGKHYLKWCQVISHLIGAGPKPGDPRFEAYDEEDTMIMVSLLNSTIPVIGSTCMFLATPKDIWDGIWQTYFKARDAAQIYEGEGDTVTSYANQLKASWQELDYYRMIKITLKTIRDFLVGLNLEFDQVKTQVLGKHEDLGTVL
ncbi:unnamed protein product [Spirodela intermedia]|uniref:Uncharacterized protein n=2 Tax=Spirodela intermedia TaxID=51605 RepID=A0A7I8JLW6_SPIIN|nr:unnamed protein product [Spirodela intermedia]CAA6670781.1 unnamed protein product [Spirodela intermedia]CAA7407868.1 unnamed protein product [Spirodela intermedia]